MTNKKISELGLAEFIAGLISETFEAISASMEDQLRRKSELSSACQMSVDKYAQAFIDDAQVEEVVTELFGSDNEEYTLEAGAVYQPHTSKTEEAPAFQALLSIELESDVHFKKQNHDMLLTQQGVDYISQSVLHRLASEQQDMLQNMINSGIPRIAVDKGKILSRVSFNLVEGEEENDKVIEDPNEVTSARHTLLSKRQNIVNRLGKSRNNLLIPNVQFKVKQASDSVETSTTSVFGEVELHFKTVD